MKTLTENKEEKKVTNEKPVSLNNLNFKEALAALLKVKPPKTQTKKRKKTQRTGK